MTPGRGSLGTIAIIGAEPTGSGIRQRLVERGYDVVMEGAAPVPSERALEADLFLACVPMPGQSVAELRSRIRAAGSEAPVIAIGSSDDLGAEESIEAVFDTVPDPMQNPHRLLGAVGYALGARQEDRELDYLRNRETADAAQMVGRDPSMRPVLHFIQQLARRSAMGVAPTILLLGETGTGKGLLAKMIHQAGVRRNRPFVQVNCAAIPDTLVESELFGHEKGAFTDARRTRVGLFETADGGTLFLDEIGSFPLHLQPKLLTALEDKRIRRVGGEEAVEVDVQVIAASQPRLRQMVKEGLFRQDLFHRLNVASVSLPPLRDRGDDRKRLAERFVSEFCVEYGLPRKTLSDDALKFIQRYHWPGNVRELRNQIERIVLLSDEPTIQGWQFERSSGEFLRVDLQQQESGMQIKLPSHGISLVEVEKELIKRALELNEGNVSATARYLGISRQTLIYRLKKHDLAAE